MSRSHRVFLCHLNHPNRLSARGLTADQAFVMPWYERFQLQVGRPPNPGKVAPSGARRRKCLRKPPPPFSVSLLPEQVFDRGDRHESSECCEETSTVRKRVGRFATGFTALPAGLDQLPLSVCSEH